MPISTPDVKRFRYVAALLADADGRAITFFESGESAGTGPVNSVPIGARFLTVAPVLADGDFHELIVDSSGKLLVNTGGSDAHDTPIASTGVVLTGMDATNPGGTFTAVSADGDATRLRASRAGIQYIAVTDAAGSSHVSVVDDNAVAPVTPAGVFIGGIYRATLATYTDGDGVVLAFDSRGRLLVSPGETGLTADIDTDQVVGPATPTGQYVVGKREATLPTYADQENSVFHFDARGRLLVVSVDPTSGNTVDIATEDSAGPTNPTGDFPLGLYRTTLPTYTNGDAANFHFSVAGRLLAETTGSLPGSSAVTSVAASAVNVTLQALNTARLGLTVFNESATATLHLKLGATASLTSYTTQIGPNGYWELPFGYTGIVDGIWTAAVGSARVTELS